jgi:hypothetical protein
MACGIISIICGFLNYLIVLKPKECMKDFRKPWVGTVHLKTLTSLIFLTPAIRVFGLQE